MEFDNSIQKESCFVIQPIFNNFYPVNNQDISLIAVNEIIIEIINKAITTASEGEIKRKETLQQIESTTRKEEQTNSKIVHEPTTVNKNDEIIFPSSLTYMERKILLLQQQTKNEFGSLSQLKKTYSRVEREKMKLKEEKEKENKDSNNTEKTLESFPNIVVATSQLLSKKRPLDEKHKDDSQKEVTHSGYTPIKRKKIVYDQTSYEDFGTFMKNAKKNKPLIQLQKEKFIQEQNKKKEEQLISRNNTAKEQVFKFEV